MTSPCAGRRPQLTLTVPRESASPAGPGGVHLPAPILPAQASTAAHEPVIVSGAYLAQPAAHARSARREPDATRSAPDRVRAGQGLFRVAAAGAGFEPA